MGSGGRWLRLAASESERDQGPGQFTLMYGCWKGLVILPLIAIFRRMRRLLETAWLLCKLNRHRAIGRERGVVRRRQTLMAMANENCHDNSTMLFTMFSTVFFGCWRPDPRMLPANVRGAGDTFGSIANGEKGECPLGGRRVTMGWRSASSTGSWQVGQTATGPDHTLGLRSCPCASPPRRRSAALSRHGCVECLRSRNRCGVRTRDECTKRNQPSSRTEDGGRNQTKTSTTKPTEVTEMNRVGRLNVRSRNLSAGSKLGSALLNWFSFSG